MENEKKPEQIPPPDFVLGFRVASSGRGLGGAQTNPRDIFGDDSDEEADHTESVRRFTKENYGLMVPGRNTFNAPKIGKPKSIEEIRRKYALKNASKSPKRPADTQWDDDIVFQASVSPHKNLKTADSEISYELDIVSPTNLVGKPYIDTQKISLIEKYATSSKEPKLSKTPEPSPDTSLDEGEESGPPSPIISSRSKTQDKIVSNGSAEIDSDLGFTGFSSGAGMQIKVDKSSVYAAKEQMSGTKFAGFSSGFGTQITVDKSVISAAREKLGDTGFASGLGSQMNADQSSVKFGGFSSGFGTQIKIDQGAVSAAKHKLADEPVSAVGKPLKLAQFAAKKKPKPSSGFSTGFGKTVKIDESAVNAAREKMDDVKVESSSVPAKPRPNFQSETRSHVQSKSHNEGEEIIFRDLFRLDFGQYTANDRFENGHRSLFDQLTESQIRIPKIEPHDSRSCFSHNRQETSMLLSLQNHLPFEVDDLQASKHTVQPKPNTTSTPKNIAPKKTLKPLELSPIRESKVFTPGEIKTINEKLTKSREYIEQRKTAVPDKKPRPGCLYRQKKDKNQKTMKLSEMKISKSTGGKEDVSILCYYSKKEILQKQIKCLDSGHLHCDENGEIRTEHFQIALQARGLKFLSKENRKIILILK